MAMAEHADATDGSFFWFHNISVFLTGFFSCFIAATCIAHDRNTFISIGEERVGFWFRAANFEAITAHSIIQPSNLTSELPEGQNSWYMFHTDAA